MTIQIERLDLLTPWPEIAMRDGHRAVRVIVHLGTTPIGELMLRPMRRRTISHDRLRRRIEKHLGGAIAQALVRDGINARAGALTAIETADGPLISPDGLWQRMREWVIESQQRATWPLRGITVAVCTRDRVEDAQRVIDHLRAIDYPAFEILVVDASRDPIPTRDLARRMRVSYVRSKSVGTSAARNSALEHARHEWVAFLDDDARPENNWLKELIRPTQDSNCRCVCGWSLSSGRYQPQLFNGDSLAQTWQIGSGGNMLLHRACAQQLGGFDLDLADGAEEAELFYRILRQGHHIHYTPRAAVRSENSTMSVATAARARSRAAAEAAYHAACLLKSRDVRSLLRAAFRPVSALRYLIAKAARWRRQGLASAAKPMLPSVILMSPPTPAPPPPRKLYDSKAPANTVRAA